MYTILLLILPLLVGIFITVELVLCAGGLAGLVICLFAKLQKRLDASKCRRDGEGFLERVRQMERAVVPFQCLHVFVVLVVHSDKIPATGSRGTREV